MKISQSLKKINNYCEKYQDQLSTTNNKNPIKESQNQQCSHEITIKHIPTGFYFKFTEIQDCSSDQQIKEKQQENCCTLPKFVPEGEPFIGCFQSDYDFKNNATKNRNINQEYIKRQNRTKDKQIPLRAAQPKRKKTKCNVCLRDFSEEGYFEHIQSEEHKQNYYNNIYFTKIKSLEKSFKKDKQKNQNTSQGSCQENQSLQQINESDNLENQDNILYVSELNDDSFVIPIGIECDISQINSKQENEVENTSSQEEEEEEEKYDKKQNSFVRKALDFISNIIPSKFEDIKKTQKNHNYLNFQQEFGRKTKKRNYSQVNSTYAQTNNKQCEILGINYNSKTKLQINENTSNQNNQIDFVMTKQVKLYSQSDSFQFNMNNKSTTCSSQKESLIQNKISTPQQSSRWEKIKKAFFSIIKND